MKLFGMVRMNIFGLLYLIFIASIARALYFTASLKLRLTAGILLICITWLCYTDVCVLHCEVVHVLCKSMWVREPDSPGVCAVEVMTLSCL